MKNVLISIIVPVYNVDKYLNRCIQSILKQTLKEFVLILVDDGSTDKSGDICDHYAKLDKRIIVIHKKNEGLPSARKKGIDVLTTKYFTFCDGDDFIGQDRLFQMLEIAENDGLDILSTSFTLYSESGSKQIGFKKIRRDLNKSKDLVKHITKDILSAKIGWAAWSRLYRTDIFKQYNMSTCNTCNGFGEDLALTLEYSMCSKKIRSIPIFDYFYVQRHGSLSRSDSNIGRLHSLNEVSYHFTSFIKDKIDNKYNPLFHLLILNTDLDTFYSENNINNVMKSFNSIKKQTYFYKSVFDFKKCILISIKYCGLLKTLSFINFRKYCLTKQNWNMHKKKYFYIQKIIKFIKLLKKV